MFWCSKHRKPFALVMHVKDRSPLGDVSVGVGTQEASYSRLPTTGGLLPPPADNNSVVYSTLWLRRRHVVALRSRKYAR